MTISSISTFKNRCKLALGSKFIKWRQPHFEGRMVDSQSLARRSIVTSGIAHRAHGADQKGQDDAPGGVRSPALAQHRATRADHRLQSDGRRQRIERSDASGEALEDAIWCGCDREP